MDFEAASKQACRTKIEDVKSFYPLVEEGNRPYLCMDLLYQYTLLVAGFGRFRNRVGTVIHDNDAFCEIFFFFLGQSFCKILRILFSSTDWILLLAGLDPWQQMTLVKKVKYHDALVEAAWPLGSAIEAVSST